MLKPYNRQIRKTNEVLSSIKSIILENTLKNENTLYDIQDMPVVTGTTKLQDITGIDNLVIVAYKDKGKHYDTVQLVDKKHGYSIEPSTNNVILTQHLVGLHSYVLTSNDRGYIIKTNYTSVEELITKFNISVRSGFDFLQTGNIDSVIIIEGNMYE